MNKIIKGAATLAVGAAMAVSMAAPASAATVAMRNDPNNYARGYCSGPNINMTYYLTVRTDISGANYYDQYSKDEQYWANGVSHYYADSDNSPHTMLTNFLTGYVRVRAEHYVNTAQGPNC